MNLNKYFSIKFFDKLLLIKYYFDLKFFFFFLSFDYNKYFSNKIFLNYFFFINHIFKFMKIKESIFKIMILLKLVHKTYLSKKIPKLLFY